jgi:hypothetical protein
MYGGFCLSSRARVTEAEAQRATLESHQIVRSEEPQPGCLRVGQALSAGWQHGSAPAARKKRMLRTVLPEILIVVV